METSPSPHMLSCNNMACRTHLSSGTVWVTYCNHIYCDTCGTSQTTTLVCISCRASLSGQHRLIRKPLKSGAAWNKLVLAGLPPETVMDICSSAILFYQNQTCQEVIYLEERIRRVMNRVESVKQYYEGVIEQFKREIASLETRLENSNTSSTTFTSRSSSDQLANTREDSRQGNGMQDGSSMVFGGFCDSSPADGWELGAKNEDSWEMNMCKEETMGPNLGEEPSFLNWGPEIRDCGGRGVARPYELVRTKITEQNKVKMNGQDVMFMERSSVLDNLNNTRTITRSAQSSYNQLPLLLGKLVGKTRSAPRLDQRGRGTSHNQLVPYTKRVF